MAYLTDTLNKYPEWDVIIVGGGPGGSVAARDCAAQGLKTLVIDKRQELGAPVRCGEGLGEAWMKIANIEYDPSFCLQESHGAALVLPNGKEVVVNTENKGYIIERKMFEKKLAEKAIRNGAHYAVKTIVTDVIKDDNGKVSGVVCKNMEGTHEIKSKLVIAADGVDSMTARYAGLKSFSIGSEVDSGFQYEMTNLKIKYPNHIHLFIGNEIAPRGYIWIFAKGNDVANVGIGISGSIDKTAKYYLDKFIAEHPEIFENASITEINGGCCPVTSPMEKPYAAGLMIVGDAARTVNAIHGGGMGTAMQSATIAAKVAKEAIDANDFSEQFLKRYADTFFEERGNQLKRVVKVRKFFEQLTDEDMLTLAEIFAGKEQEILEFSDGAKLAAFAKLFATKPRLAMLAAKTLLVQ